MLAGALHVQEASYHIAWLASDGQRFARLARATCSRDNTSLQMLLHMQLVGVWRAILQLWTVKRYLLLLQLHFPYLAPTACALGRSTLLPARLFAPLVCTWHTVVGERKAVYTDCGGSTVGRALASNSLKSTHC